MNLYEQQSANRRKTWLDHRRVWRRCCFFLVLRAGVDTLYRRYARAASCRSAIGSMAALGIGSVSALWRAISTGDRAVLAAIDWSAADCRGGGYRDGPSTS